ncbi:MAG: pyridoxine 5'-phosphate synthase [Phycisphaerae bacterium]|nr:pyridoxine 5'-phosphate synthase [Phycisphaerae bacterium]
MIKLGVNIDHVATIRQARRTDEPDPVWAAVQAELGGADGITVHLREDRRHIQDHDLRRLRGSVGVKLNQELALVPEILSLACEVKPDQATLVPEKRAEVTTEGGLEVVRNKGCVAAAVRQLKDAGIVVSLFIDPDRAQVEASAEVGADAVELHTGAFANAWVKVEPPRRGAMAATAVLSQPCQPRPDMPAKERRHGTQGSAAMHAELNRLAAARQLAIELGLDCHAGHGITYRNVDRLVALGPWGEFNIGHSIIARSVFVGLAEAVREMRRLMEA